MSRCELFKMISARVWDEICINHRRGNRLSEEGITRNVILSMIQNYVEHLGAFNIFAQKAKDEVNTGGDLELYIDNGNQHFYRILLQAKLMETNCRFENLRKFSGSTSRRQYDTLLNFAALINSDAYYLLYNGCYNYEGPGRDCAGDYDEKQFGCAVMAAQEIKEHCDSNSTGILGTADNPKPFGRPWRIFTCCEYSSENGRRLYSPAEIDMDNYFKNLFTPPGITGFINVEQLRNQQIIEENNESLHDEGWNPSARIIIAENKMIKTSDDLLEFY